MEDPECAATKGHDNDGSDVCSRCGMDLNSEDPEMAATRAALEGLFSKTLTDSGAEEAANASLIAEAPALAQALRDLRKELRAHIKFDVKRHYSLMVADAAAGTILHRIERT